MQSLRVKKIFLTACSAAVLFALCFSSAHAVFINEIHYDNTGGDSDEGVELTGIAGEDLSGWSLLLYNGSNESVYKNYALSGVFADMQQGMGVLGFTISGIQNGGADGIALVNDMCSVLQFLSYEGSLTASSGVAMGLTSMDIGVAESGSTVEGSSLQLIGAGRDYLDFSWGTAVALFGGINDGQTFAALAEKSAGAVPEPTSAVLLLLGLLLLALRYGMGNHARPVFQV